MCEEFDEVPAVRVPRADISWNDHLHHATFIEIISDRTHFQFKADRCSRERLSGEGTSQAVVPMYQLA